MIIPNCSEHDYRQSEGVSQTLLKALGAEGGPARVRYGDPHESSRTQKFGIMIHTAILQPALLEQHYKPLLKLPAGNSPERRRAESLAFGKLLVSQAEFDEARAIADAVRRWQPAAGELLDGAVVEQSFWWTHPRTGVPMKGRADAVNRAFRVMLDLKSAEDASYEGFRAAIRRWQYDIQHAHYMEGWALAGEGSFEPQAFVFLAVEKTSPYLSALYVLEPPAVERGHIERERLIDIYQTCGKTGTWPGYPQGVQPLSLERPDHV